MKQILAFLFLIVFIAIDVFIIRPINAIRSVDGAVIDTSNIVAMVVTDRHLINRTTINGLISRVSTTTLNFRPGRVSDHVKNDDVRSFFVSDNLYNSFSSSFIRWGLHEYDVNDIVFKEAVVVSQRSTRTFDAGDGKLMWFINVTMSIRDRGVGGEKVTIVKLKLTLLHRNAVEGVGIYDYQIDMI